MRRLVSAAVLILGLAATQRLAAADPPAAPQEASPGSLVTLRLLSIARQLELDMSSEEVVTTLVDAGLVVDQQRDLPPDGLSRMILAVPENDDCMPRGGQLVCPSVRVFLLNDAQRGYRATRIEAFERVGVPVTVSQVFEQAATAMGPALQTEMWPEQVRGGSVVVWRQRWRENLSDGPATEIIATQELPERPVLGIADPNSRATGIGVVIANPDLEGAFASVRRRIQQRSAR